MMRWLAWLFMLPMCVSAEVLTIAKVSESASKTVDRLQPVADAVLASMPGSRFDSAQVYVARDLDHLLAAVRDNRVHWVTESLLISAILAEEANMRPALVRHKKGVSHYGSVVLANGSMSRLSDLLGKKIAAEDDTSFSGYFLVLKACIEQGLKVTHLNSIRSATVPDAINFVFSFDEENSLAWLQKSLVAAAIFSDTDASDPEFVPETLRARANVIYESETYPRAIESLAGSLSDQEQGAITTALLRLGKDTDNPILKQYGSTSGFHRMSAIEVDQLENVYRFHRFYRDYHSAVMAGSRGQ